MGWVRLKEVLVWKSKNKRGDLEMNVVIFCCERSFWVKGILWVRRGWGKKILKEGVGSGG